MDDVVVAMEEAVVAMDDNTDVASSVTAEMVLSVVTGVEPVNLSVAMSSRAVSTVLLLLPEVASVIPSKMSAVLMSPGQG